MCMVIINVLFAKQMQCLAVIGDNCDTNVLLKNNEDSKPPTSNTMAIGFKHQTN